MKTQLEKINAEIARRNKLFKNATKAEKRVLIARDVLAQLDAKRFVAEHQTYAHTDTAENAAVALGSSSLQVGLLACPAQVSCEVCAKGALVLSKIMFTNKVNIEDADGLNDDPIDYDMSGLTRVFSKTQLDLMEAAFEGLYIRDDSSAAFYFGDNEKTADERLRIIMRNVIRNGGKFVVPKRCEAAFRRYERSRW